MYNGCRGSVCRLKPRSLKNCSSDQASASAPRSSKAFTARRLPPSTAVCRGRHVTPPVSPHGMHIVDASSVWICSGVQKELQEVGILDCIWYYQIKCATSVATTSPIILLTLNVDISLCINQRAYNSLPMIQLLLV